jgi:hypothetical protein
MSIDADQQARQIRAARNHSLFREVNERIRDVRDRLRDESASGGDTHVTFVCECADTSCAE